MARMRSRSERSCESWSLTDIDPDFGRQLIRESPELLLAHVGAAHETAREPALDFLKALSGEDFGADVEAWTAWINDLGAVG